MTDPGRTLEGLRTVADYQFGAGAGAVLFPEGTDHRIDRSRSGRPRQIHGEAGRVASFGTDGRFTLGIEGGRRLHEGLEPPAYRVVVDDESEPFVVDGKNVFARFVRDADEVIRPRDEVLVVHERGDLLGVGRAVHDGRAMLAFERGMAVAVRESRSASR